MPKNKLSAAGTRAIGGINTTIDVIVMAAATTMKVRGAARPAARHDWCVTLRSNTEPTPRRLLSAGYAPQRCQ